MENDGLEVQGVRKTMRWRSWGLGGAKGRPRAQVKASLGAFGGPLVVDGMSWGSHVGTHFGVQSCFFDGTWRAQSCKGRKFEFAYLTALSGFRAFEIRVFQFLDSERRRGEKLGLSVLEQNPFRGHAFPDFGEQTRFLDFGMIFYLLCFPSPGNYIISSPNEAKRKDDTLQRLNK